MADPCVVGLDVGGSHSRAVLATVDGRTLGTGRAGGGNPTVLGAGAAIANIVAALKAALGPVPGERVGACVVGLAGVSTLMADPRAPRVLEQAWADVGLTCPVQVLSDVTVSFAAGTPAPDGTLLVSGTGAVAARMHDRLPARFRDGYGWLLGDEGSGFWIGRQAARAAIAAADGREPMAELAKSVLAHLLDHPENGAENGPGADPGTDPKAKPDAGSHPGSDAGPETAPSQAVEPDADPRAATASGRSAPGGTSGSTPGAAPDRAPNRTSVPTETQITQTPTVQHPSAPVRPAATGRLPVPASIGEGFTLRGRRRAAELVRAVTAQPTVALSRLAPLVMAAYELGDPAAARIVAEAAEVLVESLAGVGPVAGEPVVLGGSVLVSRSPVFQAVTSAIGRRWPDSPVGLAADGAAGATWLAARQVLGAAAAAAGHAAFTRADHQFAEFS
ncbi:BadF/BadG/BcrA/BcrD ATPase family protein [Catenulispora pinisilvae]|uniref:BadF/BadG/BcrA/BcrD ATPase family protein n=1 Tax=Catenulispora pinisilvae TaxID=2705253 RepID=UPI00189225B9|nr:BadF/BadG/BcrA/BcrD ATPase family protein [Catenulispora pinisilvae]